jgi:hypothetical protein
LVPPEQSNLHPVSYTVPMPGYWYSK